MDDFILSPYASTLDRISKQRYLEKLNVAEDCRFPDPYTVVKSQWIKDPSLWPPVEFGDIYIYLKSSGEKDYDEETLKNYKSLSAYEYVVSGKVHNVCLFVKEQFFLLTAEVQRSFRVNLSDHLPWVITAHNGTVKAAHCTCMAGLGEACSHVAALLFQIELENRLRSCAPTPTDVACKWQRPSKKKVESLELKHIDFSKCDWSGSKNKKRKLTFIKIPDLPPLTTDDWLELKRVCPDAVCLQGMFSDDSSTDSASEAENEQPLPKIIPLIKEATRKNIDLKDFLISHFTKANCLNLNQQTMGQSANPSWFECRKGHLTASKFKKALKRKNWSNDFVKTVANLTKEICQPAMKWGIDQEKNALSSFVDFMSCTHKNFSVRSCGFIVHPQYPYLGATPDGISFCDCCGEGIVEIKCPYKYKNSTIDKALDDKLFCLSKEKTLKENHDYYYQVQGQMAVSQLRFCHFVVWTELDMAVQYIEFQEDIWDSNKIMLEDIYFRHIVPVLKDI